MAHEKFKESVVLTGTKFDPDPEFARSIRQLVTNLGRQQDSNDSCQPYPNPEVAGELLEDIATRSRPENQLDKYHLEKGYRFYDNVPLSWSTSDARECQIIRYLVAAIGLANVLLDGRVQDSEGYLLPTSQLIALYVRDQILYKGIAPLSDEEDVQE